MFDASPKTLQRIRGRAAVRIGRRGLTDLAQAGSAKAFLPRTHSVTPEVVFLNTAGGLTGGDHLSYGLTVGKKARITGTTQTAERAYRSASGVAEVDVTLRVGSGGHLDWLPQETILFDGAGLDRRTDIHLEGKATCLIAETIVLGRAAMGETVKRLALRDRRRVMREGRPVWLEPLELTDATVSANRTPATLGTARALATAALIDPYAEDRLDGLRARLMRHSSVRAEASAWEGRLILRALADDAFALRRMMAECLEYLRGAPMPRVWQV